MNEKKKLNYCTDVDFVEEAAYAGYCQLRRIHILYLYVQYNSANIHSLVVFHL